MSGICHKLSQRCQECVTSCHKDVTKLLNIPPLHLRELLWHDARLGPYWAPWLIRVEFELVHICPRWEWGTKAAIAPPGWLQEWVAVVKSRLETGWWRSRSWWSRRRPWHQRRAGGEAGDLTWRTSQTLLNPLLRGLSYGPGITRQDRRKDGKILNMVDIHSYQAILGWLLNVFFSLAVIPNYNSVTYSHLQKG